MTELKGWGVEPGDWGTGPEWGQVVKPATKCELLFPRQTDGEPKCE